MEVALRCTSGPKPVPTMGTVLQAVALSYRGLMQELDTGLNVWKQGSQRHGCAPTWFWTPSCDVRSSQQVSVNNSIFLDYVHRVPFDQVNAISIKGGVYVSRISFQVRLHPALVPMGWVWGPIPLQVLLSEPKVQPVSSPGASGFTPLAAPVCPSVAVSVWGTRSGSWTSRFFVSVTLCHPPGEETLCF